MLVGGASGWVTLVVLTLGLLGGCGEPSVEAADDTGGPSEAPTEIAPREVMAFYVGDGPRGPVLFREVRWVYEPDHGPAEAIGLLSSTPLDPDYRTAWPPGAFTGGLVNVDDGTVDVLLADSSLRDRPPSVDEAEARASIQQVVYTLQEYAGEPLPVRFLLDERPVDRVLGVRTPEPVAAAPILQTVSLMSLVAPVEGQLVSGSFRASGLNNGYEGTAAWQVLDASGSVVAQGATIGGSMSDRLFPWHDRVDVSGLAPGKYTFLASNDDPTGGTEGFGADTDTRTIVVQ